MHLKSVCRLLSIPVVVGCSMAVAHAQSYSSFTNVGAIHGITLNKIVSNGVASYSLSLAPNAGYGSTTITNIFGFFELFDNPVSSVIPSSYTTPGGWIEKDDISGHHITGQMFGYENNNKSNAVTSSNSVGGFEFLNTPTPSSFGFHVTAGNGKTFFIKGSLTSTPEASSLMGLGALLCSGGLFAIRRKLRRTA